MLLPVPDTPEVRRQVISNEETKETYKHNSRMTIEHLFYHCLDIGPLFREIPDRPGNLLEFPNGQKTVFAREVMPRLAEDQFEKLRPLFDQIQSRIRDVAARVVA